jgi:hypothetical protein
MAAVRFPAAARAVSLLRSVKAGFGAHPLRIAAISPRARRPERDADYSRPSSADVRICGATP